MASRRTFLKTMIMGGAVTAFSGLVPGINALAATPLRVRRDISKMALNDPDLETYRDFVEIMRKKDQTSLFSWLGFASQHGDKHMSTYCPHGSWYFLPWHRAYMEMYEQAAMALTRNPSFAMPYWNWTSPSERSLPAAFTTKTYSGKPNPLYVPYNPANTDGYPINQDTEGDRNTVSISDTVTGSSVVNQILNETVFEAFGSSRNPLQTDFDPKWAPMGGGMQGRLESTPHNLIHDEISAYMPNMHSPRDPIFMLHHGKIDQIWAYWNALGRMNPGVYDPSDPTNSKYPNCDPQYPNGSLWFNMPFTNNFISPTGKFYTRKVSDMVSTKALGYTYDNMPPTLTTANLYAKKANNIKTQERDQNLLGLFNSSVKGSARRFKPTNLVTPENVEIVLDRSNLDAVVNAPRGARKQGIVALISDIDIGDNVRAIRVFINGKTLSQETPETDPHYVTTLGFLRHGMGSDHKHPHSLPSTIVDVTETLVKLAKTVGITGDVITVQLLPVPRDKSKPVGKVIPKQIEIAVI